VDSGSVGCDTVLLSE